MEDRQNWTVPTQTQIDEADLTQTKQLKLQQELWIDYCAIGGIITEAGFEYKRNEYTGKDVPEIMKRMSVKEFSEKVHVPRSTLYNWNKTIPNFAQRVRERREEIWPLARETALFNRAYSIAMGSNDMRASVDAIRLLTGHFSKLRLPTQTQEIEFKGQSWAALAARKRAEALEGEVIDEPSSNNS